MACPGPVGLTPIKLRLAAPGQDEPCAPTRGRIAALHRNRLGVRGTRRQALLMRCAASQTTSRSSASPSRSCWRPWESARPPCWSCSSQLRTYCRCRLGPRPSLARRWSCSHFSSRLGPRHGCRRSSRGDRLPKRLSIRRCAALRGGSRQTMLRVAAHGRACPRLLYGQQGQSARPWPCSCFFRSRSATFPLRWPSACAASGSCGTTVAGSRRVGPSASAHWCWFRVFCTAWGRSSAIVFDPSASESGAPALLMLINCRRQHSGTLPYDSEAICTSASSCPWTEARRPP